MTSYALRGLDGSGYFELPDFQDFTAAFEFSDIGALTLNYPVSGKNASRLAHLVQVMLLVDGVEPANGRWLLKAIGGNEDNNNAAVLNWTGRSIIQVMEGAVVLGATPSAPTAVPFTAKTPGEIIRTLLLQAQARGALTGITFGTFSNTLDSNGVAWGSTYTQTYDKYVKYIDVFRDLVNKGLIEFKMVGLDLRVYKADGMHTDRTTLSPAVTLRSGIDFSETPFTSTVDGYVSDVYVEGDNGALQIRTGASTHPFGKQEDSIAISGTSDSGNLILAGDAELAARRRTRVEKTRGLVFSDETQFWPLQNYEVSDYIYQQSAGLSEKIRVRSLTVQGDQNGANGGSIVLNDKFVEEEIKQARAISSILGGSVAGGPNAPSAGTDTTIPNAPTVASVASLAFVQADGTPGAVVTVTVTPPATNTDTSAFADLGLYMIRWRYADSDVPPNPGEWQQVQGSSSNVVSFSPVRNGVDIEVQALVSDTSNHLSAWSATSTHTTATDSTAPPVPSTPIASAYLGSLKITWDGAFVAAAPKPADFRHVEIHVATTSGFTPDDTTLVGTLVGPGTASVPALTYGQTYYVKFKSVDTYGNKSAPSAVDTAIPTQASAGDIEASVLADVSSDPVFVHYFGASDGASGWSEYAGQGVLNYSGLTGSTVYSATFETGSSVFTTSASGYTTAQSTALSSAQAHSGTQSMLITWAAGAAFSQAPNRFWNKLVPGRIYEVTVWVYVPTGMPHVQLRDLFGSIGRYDHATLPGTSTVRNSWQQLGMMIAPTAGYNPYMGIKNAEAATAGQTVYVDDWAITDVSLDETYWFNDTNAPTVPGVLRLNGPQSAEWVGSNPFPYDPEAVYNFRGRFKLTVPELCRDRDFALGTNANWDNFWGGGSVTWVYSGNTGKATSAAAGQNAVLRNGGTNSNEVTEGTIIRVSGKVRTSYNSGSGPFVEVVTSTTAGQAIYFGTGAVVGGSLTIDPSPDAVTYNNFYVEFTIPAGHICYTVYFRDVLDNAQWVEWDDLSIKELSPTVKIGMIAYKADRTTPVEPDDTGTTKTTIHAALDTNAGVTKDDWYEFDAYISDRSDGASSGTGATAKTARNLASQARYWRPAIILGAANDAVVTTIMDVDWFQIDRVKANFNIPGSITAAQFDAEQMATQTLIVSQALSLSPDASPDYLLTALDSQGSAGWRRKPPAAVISPDGTPPAGLVAGDLWINQAAQGDTPLFVTAVGPSTQRNLFLGTTYTKITDFGDVKLTIPCDGVLEIDFYCWVGWATAGTAGTAVSLGYVEMDVNTAGYTAFDEGHFDYWYHRNVVSVANNLRDVRVQRTVRFDSVPADGVDISLYVMGYGSISQAVALYPRYRIKFTPYANMIKLTM